MTWIQEEDTRTWFQKLCCNILKQGPIPQHVGIIMDGNRRFARKSSIANIEGHTKGFEKLAETLRWCLDFGINEVTVYVFSIENFKRSQEEVNSLMDLAIEKFEKLLQEKDKLEREGVCIQIVGDMSLIPDRLKNLMAKAMVLTRHNTRAKLNVAFAYTSRNEITRGIQDMNNGVLQGDLLPEDLNENLLTNSFQLLPTQPLDLLVRTSGETRLSDFLLWQSAETVLCFTSVLWPEFTIWHLMAAIFQFQVNYMSMIQMPLRLTKSKSALRANYFNEDKSIETNEDISSSRPQKFLEKLQREKWRMLEEQSNLVSI